MTQVVRFHHDDDRWWFSDLTGPEVLDLEKSLGENYMRWQLESAKVTLAILATFLSRTRTEVEVAEIINGMTLADILKCWDVEEDDLPTEFRDGVPLGGPASTDTTTGSGSSSDLPGAGLPTLPDANPSET